MKMKPNSNPLFLCGLLVALLASSANAQDDVVAQVL